MDLTIAGTIIGIIAFLYGGRNIDNLSHRESKLRKARLSTE